MKQISYDITASKVSKYGAISGPYFPVFGLNKGKYEPEETPIFGTFQAVIFIKIKYFPVSF